MLVWGRSCKGACASTPAATLRQQQLLLTANSCVIKTRQLNLLCCSACQAHGPASQLQGQLQVGLQPLPVAAPLRQEGGFKQLALALQRQGIPVPQNVLQQGSQLHT